MLVGTGRPIYAGVRAVAARAAGGRAGPCSRAVDDAIPIGVGPSEMATWRGSFVRGEVATRAAMQMQACSCHTVSPARKNAPISRTLVQRAAHVKVRRSRRCVTCADRKWRRTLREVSAQGPVQLPLTRLLRSRLQVFLCVGVLDHPRTSR